MTVNCILVTVIAEKTGVVGVGDSNVVMMFVVFVSVISVYCLGVKGIGLTGELGYWC